MRNRWCTALFFFLLAFVSASGDAQSTGSVVAGTPTIAEVPSPLSLEVEPSFQLPLGDSSRLFSYGGGMQLDMHYRIPGSLFYLLGGLQYAYASTLAAESVSFATARVGAGVQIPLTRKISLLGYAVGGYYFGTFNDFSVTASDPYAAGGIGFMFALGSGLSINVGGQYEYYFGGYQGLSAGAGIGIALGNLGGSIGIPAVHIRPAFPVFYKYYDDHPIGSMELQSSLKVPATNIRVQVFIKEFMDAPKLVDVPGILAPGSCRTVDLYALFTDKVLNTTEGTKVAAEILVTYSVDGAIYQDRKIETLTLTGRNAITWDDNRKAAAYVTAKDPGVLKFARGVTSYVEGKENRSISTNLQAAIALQAALDIYGLNYSTNQRKPYSEVSNEKDVIDFVQFPRETFQYRAGDCSDISILYGALFQAVGIDAAFITIPGHIFIAFDSGLTPEEAPQELIPEGQFIAYQGKAWIPFEVTSIHDGFRKAWELGAKEWNENVRQGLEGFYPIKEAWALYPPVGLPGAETVVSVPDSGKVLAAYLRDVQQHIDAGIGPQVAKLKAQIQGTGSLVAKNNLGVLYAKFGQMEKAEQQFREIVAGKADIAAILNLGNIYFIRKDWKNALAMYRQASALSPNSSQTLLALARVNVELKQYDAANSTYQMLKAQDPVLAGQFSFPGEAEKSGARNADVRGEREAVRWENDR